MLIKINPKDGLPVYLQIVRQVKHQVVSGALSFGQQLPSAKDLAMRLLINANTVAKAYSLLEREGVVTCRRGSGTYVAENPPVVANMRTARQRMLPMLTRLSVEAGPLGKEREQVAVLLDKAWRETEKE